MAEAQLVRAEHRIPSSHVAGLGHFRRERHPPPGQHVRPVPLLLVHGATIASALWDAALPGCSWMDRLARDGFHVFALDLRGYGASGRPAAFDAPPEDTPAYARAADVIDDVADAVDYLCGQTGAARLDLLGGSWGSIVCGKFVAERAAGKVRGRILYAPIYADRTQRPDWLPVIPGGLDDGALARHMGAYRRVTVDDLRRRWNEEIPTEDPVVWRPRGMLETMVAPYVEDRSGAGHGSFRVPSGTLVDLCRAFDGQAVYDYRQVKLLIRGDADPISTARGTERLRLEIGTPDYAVHSIKDGAHFMIAERALPRVHATIADFLTF